MTHTILKLKVKTDKPQDLGGPRGLYAMYTYILILTVKGIMMEAAIAGLVGALLGSSASIVTTYLNHRHGIKLQTAADALSRLEKARAFQRDNLLACQEIMQTVGRMTGQMHFSDTVAFRQGGNWGANVVGGTLNEDIATAKRKLAALTERVEDDQLRGELKSVNTALTEVIMAPSSEKADAAFILAMETYESTMQLVGTIMRKTY